MGPVLAFWAVSLLVGVLALPVAFLLLRRLPDAGAGLSFPLGLLLTGYAYFILRTLKVLPAGRGGYALALALLAFLAVYVAARDRRFASTVRRSWPAFMAVAGLFTLAFFAYVTFRSYAPDIAGTEQPMDFMYLNATVASPDYPPLDPWLSGERASYYYFGYEQIGVLTELAGVRTSTGYNLGLAYTFAAAATGIASLAFALARWALGTRGRSWALAAAVLAVVMLLAIGSLSAVFELAAAHGHYNRDLYGKFGVEWLIPCQPGATEDCFSGFTQPRTTAWYPTEYWFWWRGTRIIPNTITEFPFFSFLLGDMHPHVMSIPLVLLSMGLSAAAWRGRSALNWLSLRREPVAALVVAVVLGGLAFENAWDVLTFSGIYAVAVLVRNLRRRPPLGAVRASALYLGPLALVAVVAYLPWYLTFSSQADGFYPYIGQGTRPAHAFLQFGALLLAALLALTWAVRRHDLAAAFNAALSTIWVPLLPMLVWLAMVIFRGELTDAVDARKPGGWVTLVLYAVITWALATAFAVLAVRRHPAAIAVGFATVGALLLFGCELFYIGDIFKGFLPRNNTVFKLAYQAWILLSVAGAVAFVVAVRKLWSEASRAALLAMPVATLLAAGLVYPLTALPNRTDGFDKGTDVDGLAFLARNDPDEYALTRWVQDHTAPGEVIIEGSGRSLARDSSGAIVTSRDSGDYSDAGRISARTGRPTLIGWYQHEVQWRGDTVANRLEFDRRRNLLDRAYSAVHPEEVVDLMRNEGARYLVVGKFERQWYPADIMPHYDDFLDVVFKSGDLRVYALPAYEAVPAR